MNKTENLQFFVDCCLANEPTLYELSMKYTWPRDVKVSAIDVNTECISYFLKGNKIITPTDMFLYEIRVDANLNRIEILDVVQARIARIPEDFNCAINHVVYGYGESEDYSLNFNNMHRALGEIDISCNSIPAELMRINETIREKSFETDSVICGSEVFGLVRTCLRGYKNVREAPIDNDRIVMYNWGKSLDVKLTGLIRGTPYLDHYSNEFVLAYYGAINKGGLSINNADSIACIKILF